MHKKYTIGKENSSSVISWLALKLSLFSVVCLLPFMWDPLYYHRTVLMCHVLTYVFLLVSVLQIACVYSRTVSGNCYGEAWGWCPAEETELRQSVVQPSKDYCIINIISSSTSRSNSPSTSRNFRHNTKERYMQLLRTSL